MSTILHHKTCEICGNTTIYTNPCQFCKKMICSKEAHYIPSKEQTIYGIKNTVLRVCPDCNPKKPKAID